MEVTHTRAGDYYRPNLVGPESPKVGRYGTAESRESNGMGCPDEQHSEPGR